MGNKEVYNCFVLEKYWHHAVAAPAVSGWIFVEPCACSAAGPDSPLLSLRERDGNQMNTWGLTGWVCCC